LVRALPNVFQIGLVPLSQTHDLMAKGVQIKKESCISVFKER